MSISDLGAGGDAAAINAKYKGLSSGKNNERGKREVDQENLEKALIAQKSSIVTFTDISIIESIMGIIGRINSLTSLVNNIESSLNSLEETVNNLP